VFDYGKQQRFGKLLVGDGWMQDSDALPFAASTSHKWWYCKPKGCRMRLRCAALKARQDIIGVCTRLQVCIHFSSAFLSIPPLLLSLYHHHHHPSINPCIHPSIQEKGHNRKCPTAWSKQTTGMAGLLIPGTGTCLVYSLALD